MALEYEELTGKIIGGAIEVHKALGPGFIESVYENALVEEMRQRGILFEKQKTVPVFYRGVEVGTHRLDLFVGGSIVVELKTVTDVTDAHFAVVRSYLRAMHRNHGLILNFSKPKLEVKRVMFRE
jgi:GxxExxY protein